MLSIILKGTNMCNLSCNYCSLGKKIDTKLIDENMLTDILRYVCKVCEYRNENKLNLILHGGEPTLVPCSIYEYALTKIYNEYSDIDIKVSMQTNGVKLNDEILDFIKKYDVHIGISIDGSKKIHNSERKDINGNETFDIVTNNIIKLLTNDINVSCLMVLTNKALKEGYDYLDFFEKWKLHLKINPLLNYGEAYENPELLLKPEDYANYLIDIYKYIINNDKEVSISPIDKILQGILSDGKIHECTFDAQCNNNFLCVDYNGDIYPCGRYSDMNLYKIGNISNQILDIMNTPIMKNLINRRNCNLPQKCTRCKYLKICNAGCNAEEAINKDSEKIPSICTDYKKLLDFFYKEGLMLLKEKLIERKNFLLEMQNNGI